MPSGLKRSKPVELFADADELDRLAGNLAHRQRSTAARIAIKLREDHAGQWQAFGECLGGIDGVLSQHRVNDEQGLDRSQALLSAATSCIIASSIASRPAVSTISTSKNWRRA